MVEFTYASGLKMFSQCRHIKGCMSRVAEEGHGTRGTVSFSGGSITAGNERWRFTTDTPMDPYQVEHDDLFHALRNDLPYNEAENGARATMTAILGRMATEIATLLRGKHKPEFTPHVDTGDYIVVVNVDKLRVTGRKAENKIYYRHTGYPGGVYSASFAKLQARHPDRVLRLAVKGMLPKGPLGYAMIKKMKMYTGADHPHTAQQPKPLEV